MRLARLLKELLMRLLPLPQGLPTLLPVPLLTLPTPLAPQPQTPVQLSTLLRLRPQIN